MGNCLRHESSTQWGGEDFASPPPEQPDQPFFPANKKNTTSSPNTTTKTKTTEVKIKVTKRQLEKLLGKVDLKELSVQQVLAQLMAIGVQLDGTSHDHRSWRPALQSIPE